MELIILGSSAAIPVNNRNLPSVALTYNSNIILFDCGEDLQRKFNDAKLKFNKPLIILISHFHGDHIIGLPGLLFRFNLIDRTAPVSIIGPKDLFLYLFFHSKILGLKANYPLNIYEIDHEKQLLTEYNGLLSDSPKSQYQIKNNIILEEKRFNIRYCKVDHSIDTYAYSFIEDHRYGRFHPEKAEDLGIPQSRLWKKLQSGEKITFKDKIIDPYKEGIVDSKIPGRKITYSGDTKPCETLIRLGKDSDIIVHEATFSKELSKIAVEKMHSTSVDAASDAKKMNAKLLVLTHISSRYQEDAQLLLEEAKQIFPNSILAEDLMRLEIK
ncbi:MAG: ribonuclease Z [Candidatus Lokiarchaeota archaeon]|nr:ribonuclease Z [Candidatus Lokiarchaeota archaeon]